MTRVRRHRPARSRRVAFIAVVAGCVEQAIREPERLKRTGASKPACCMLSGYKARTEWTEDNLLIDQGEFRKRFRQAAIQLHVTYYQPYHADASIGPSCAVADVKADQITVWASTPGPYPLSNALARSAPRCPSREIDLMHVEGAGSYGQNGSDDAAGDAPPLSQAVGSPVTAAAVVPG